MGLTALLVQTVAGDIVDKTWFDRRLFLVAASFVTALSASAILLVQGNSGHGLMYSTKIVEGIASSFIGPCLASLTLANFGPQHFDAIMASNILWGHIGSVASAM
jgi:MFS family permease